MNSVCETTIRKDDITKKCARLNTKRTIYIYANVQLFSIYLFIFNNICFKISME